MILEMIKVGKIEITDTPDFDAFMEAICGIEIVEDLLFRVNSECKQRGFKMYQVYSVPN